MLLLRCLDLVLIALAAPILLLIGVAPGGYGIGAGAWIALRALGVGVDRAAMQSTDTSRQIGLKLGYLLGRLFLLALAIVLARRISRDDGLTALLVIVVAYTVQLAISFVTRPGKR